MRALEPITVEQVQAARLRISPRAQNTPLVRLELPHTPAEIWLKLECLQPIGSFKLRGAGNAMACLGREAVRHGVYTASAGNMAQGVAWNAREMGVACKVVVPDHAPRTKLDAVERMGGEVIPVPFDEWWQVMVTHRHRGLEECCFIHPVSEPDVIAGNGTIGLEILEDLPEVDAVIAPFGGGGLSCGIAASIRAVKPHVKIWASEVSTAAPLAASLQAGYPRQVDYNPSFVDGIGGKTVLEEMWPLVARSLDGSLVVSLEEVADAVRVLARSARVIAEGAGAAPLAAALTGRAGGGKIVCVISGGNIDAEVLVAILRGEMP